MPHRPQLTSSPPGTRGATRRAPAWRRSTSPARSSGTRFLSPNRPAFAAARPVIGRSRPRPDKAIAMADIEADVIVVGSGIAGALLAAKLASAGGKVAILAAGEQVY